MKSDYLKLHLIVVIWGFTGVLGALIDLDAVHIVWHRMLIASAGMFLWMAILGKNLLLGWRDAVKTLGTGVIIALHWISFFHSIKVSNVSVALACMSTVSFFTALLEPLFFKRRIIPYELLFGLLIIAGLYLIFRFEPGYSEGIIFSVISSFLAALFTVINGLLIRERQANLITMYEMLGGLTAISVYLLFTGGMHAESLLVNPINYGWLLILGLVCTAYAFMASVDVMKSLTPFTVTITVNLEPVYAILLALLIFKEKEFMSMGFYAGTAIILVTIFANTWLKKRMVIKSIPSSHNS